MVEADLENNSPRDRLWVSTSPIVDGLRRHAMVAALRLRRLQRRRLDRRLRRRLRRARRGLPDGRWLSPRCDEDAGSPALAATSHMAAERSFWRQLKSTRVTTSVPPAEAAAAVGPCVPCRAPRPRRALESFFRRLAATGVCQRTPPRKKPGGWHCFTSREEGCRVVARPPGTPIRLRGARLAPLPLAQSGVREDERLR